MALKRNLRLTPDRWAEAALLLGSQEGLDAISMERVSAELGVTKGSAYHHFNSRSALLDAALHRWEQRATQNIIDKLAPLSSSRERLAAILAESVGRNPDKGIEYHILTSPDPLAIPVIERVTSARLAFLEEIYGDFDLDTQQAQFWARLCYSTYLGMQVLHHTLPADTRLSVLSLPDLAQVEQQLTPPGARNPS